MTVILAEELGRYGVRVNAIVPVARTRMTEEVAGIADLVRKPDDPSVFDNFHPAQRVAARRVPRDRRLSAHRSGAHGAGPGDPGLQRTGATRAPSSTRIAGVSVSSRPRSPISIAPELRAPVRHAVIDPRDFDLTDLDNYAQRVPARRLHRGAP